MKVVFCITLSGDGSPHNSTVLQRLPPPNKLKPYSIRFIIAAGSPALIEASLMTNYPLDGKEFDRSKFKPVQFNYDFNNDGFFEFEVSRAGPFEYFVEYWNENECSMKSSSIGYVIIDPLLYPSSAKETEDCILNLDSICLLTVVPKWLGPISTWKNKFETIYSNGYNLIHFVPLQKRGESNSPYSIYDQLSYSNDLFDTEFDDEMKNSFMKDQINALYKQGLLSITDIVLNHTANNSLWIAEHPEAGYNLVNSPHLMPAYVLDEAILDYSDNLHKISFLPGEIKNEQDLSHILDYFRNNILSSLRLWEFFVLNVDSHLERYSSISCSTPSNPNLQTYLLETDFKRLDFTEMARTLFKLSVLDRKPDLRFGTTLSTIDMFTIMGVLCEQPVNQLPTLKKLLEEINLIIYKEYDNDVNTIMRNISNRVRYERLEEHGPKIKAISRESPIMSTYFARLKPKSNNHNWSDLILAVNGWIWNADPLIDFAGPSSKSYFVREVIPWGDCVKLRYGKEPSESPWLWKHMENYTVALARTFAGFRIDNCHSTPIHVAQYFLDKARTINPNLYVIAELFTGSAERDLMFVSKLGLNSLIREAMNAWDPTELSRLIHKYGGQPVGSISLKAEYLPSTLSHQKLYFPEESQIIAPTVSFPPETSENIQFHSMPVPDLDESGRKTPLGHRGKKEQALKDELVLTMNGSDPNALFMDCTHDNEPPYIKRQAEDTLSTSALVCMSCCAIGSVQGYDQIVPFNLNIVTERRLYNFEQKGIDPVKKYLLRLHTYMGQKGYTEIHVHQEHDFIAVHRQDPLNHHGYFLLSRTAFKNTSNYEMAPFKLRNLSFRFILAAKIHCFPSNYNKNSEFINGLPIETELYFDLSKVSELALITTEQDELGKFVNIKPLNFPPGSILLLETFLEKDALNNLLSLKSKLDLNSHGAWYLDGIVRSNVPGLSNCLKSLSLDETNVILYRVDAEERDSCDGNGSYAVNGSSFPYCGLDGFCSHLRAIAISNDLGAPLCENLRRGVWALDYVHERLSRYEKYYPNLYPIQLWLKERLQLIKGLPNFLIPKYFSIVLLTTHREVQTHSLNLMNEFVRHGPKMRRMLALGASQFYGRVPSTGLNPFHPTASIAAGLPHFSTHHMRCWGRDVFISLKGLYIITGQMKIAKDHLLTFASCLKHGLIPNLLDCCRNPRYNARDAVWFFLKALQDFCKAEGNSSILREQIKMRFDGDEYTSYDNQRSYSKSMSLADIVLKILEYHANGIDFEEWNAGPNLDSCMRHEGFRITISLNENTGFIHGGNRWNCGTWMDKMGESERGGNLGVPATPRDGAAIELVAILKSTLKWLNDLAAKKDFPTDIILKSGKNLSLKEWEKKIQDNFERCFYIPKGTVDNLLFEDQNLDSLYDLKHEFLSRRGIYKDTYASSNGFTDYQFRPNVFLAMAIAPELFKKEHAKECLILGKQVLLGPVGIKTLDPSDFNYRPNYYNSLESTDYAVSRGFNYHQGPEWVWIMCYFWLSYYEFFKEDLQDPRITHEIHQYLKAHRYLLFKGAYGGLPELTNENGKDCPDSCPTQAWSMGCVLELLHKIEIKA